MKNKFVLGPRMDAKRWNERGDSDWLWIDDLKFGEWMLNKILEML